MTPRSRQTDTSAQPAIRPLVPEILERGRTLLAEGDAEGAMQSLRPAFDDDPANAQLRSHYGLALGLARRRYHEARDLCQSAVKQEFSNAELYVNVARLNLAYGFKAEALRHLRRARMIDPASLEIQDFFDQLGLRSKPVFQFLPRRHPINRWLGSMRSLFSSRPASRDAEGRSRRSQTDQFVA